MTVNLTRCLFRWTISNGDALKMTEMFNNVNHPKHYTTSQARCDECNASIECIQITQHLNFCLGNAVKYIWRVDSKGGVEDLKKAIWYLEQEIRKRGE